MIEESSAINRCNGHRKRRHALASPDRVRDRTAMRIVTWNINSLRLRLGLLERLAAHHNEAGLPLNVALTARDADVIKTYVRLGLGVGIVACMAVTEDEDQDLVANDGSHLFAEHVTWLGVRRGRLLRSYMYDFIRLFAPQLNRKLVDQALRAPSSERVEEVFAGLSLPRY